MLGCEMRRICSGACVTRRRRLTQPPLPFGCGLAPALGCSVKLKRKFKTGLVELAPPIFIHMEGGVLRRLPVTLQPNSLQP